jgi:aminopeptidase N
MMIPRVYLTLGPNVLTVRYTSKFSNDGFGCVSFTDTSVEPHQFYTYTHFEPYFAHRVFPCFDQPDLKAPLSLTVILPADWTAVGNEIVAYEATYTEVDYTAHAP